MQHNAAVEALDDFLSPLSGDLDPTTQSAMRGWAQPGLLSVEEIQNICRALVIRESAPQKPDAVAA